MISNGTMEYVREQEAPAFDPEGVPYALKERPQWICWKYVERDGGDTKCPVDPRTGQIADATDRAIWCSFEEALAAWRTLGCAGVGFVFSEDDPFTGIDLDDCLDLTGDPVPSAREIIDEFNSYTEISPSGKGVKIFIVAAKRGSRCRSKAIKGFAETEIYSKGRFFTVTGRLLPGCPPTVERRQEQLDALCRRLWPPPPAPLPGFHGSDDELIEKACTAANGERFKRLFEGDTSPHGGDDSAADLALCNYLAFWTGKDPDRMDRLFRRSGLMREKWDERRGDRTYGQRTIDCAIASCSEVYTPRRRLPPPEPDRNGSDGPVPLGCRDPETGRLVISKQRTLPTAEAYVREFNQHPNGRTLQSHGEVLMEWRDNRYVQVEDEYLKHRLQPWLHDAVHYVVNRSTGELELRDFPANPQTVNQALETIRAFAHIPASTTSPSWLDDGDERPLATEILPCRTLNLHLPTGRVLEPTPALFTVNALDFDYDPGPEPPEQWIRFLEQLFGDDLASVELLQEWMGYCLTSDTSQQKMLLVVGPRRSGKGTMGRILTRLAGAGNVIGPTTSSLAGQFGLQPLLNKSLAIVSDARFSGDKVALVAERLLCISGEDTITVDRKHLPSVTVKLPTRFIFLTNEVPQLPDASAALAGRFLILRLTESFYGREDPTLTERLCQELPGILRWAIDGWRRLRERGRFEQPSGSADLVHQMEELGSPMRAFVRECCVVAPARRVSTSRLYAAWQRWCRRDGGTATTAQAFGRDLAAAFPSVKPRRGTRQERFYEGIDLKGPTDEDQD